MSALTLPACLITQPVQFEPPSGSPSSIESPPTAVLQLDDIVRLRLDETPPVMELEFEVDVRDPDVDENLEFLVYVDFNSESPRLAEIDRLLPAIDRTAGTDRTRRRVSFTLDVMGTPLVTSNRCHRVEMFVSTGFRGQTRVPDVDGDLGTAVWWVATQETRTSIVDMGSCP